MLSNVGDAITAGRQCGHSMTKFSWYDWRSRLIGSSDTDSDRGGSPEHTYHIPRVRPPLTLVLKGHELKAGELTALPYLRGVLPSIKARSTLVHHWWSAGRVYTLFDLVHTG